MTLQEYLEKKLGEMAQQDANFRERYEDKQKAIKQAVGNCAAISDDDVLQMAVHYYQEKDVEPTQETVQAKVVAAPKEDKPKTAVLIPKSQPKKAKKVDNSLQLDLLGGM